MDEKIRGIATGSDPGWEGAVLDSIIELSGMLSQPMLQAEAAAAAFAGITDGERHLPLELRASSLSLCKQEVYEAVKAMLGAKHVAILFPPQRLHF